MQLGRSSPCLLRSRPRHAPRTVASQASEDTAEQDAEVRPAVVCIELWFSTTDHHRMNSRDGRIGTLVCTQWEANTELSDGGGLVSVAVRQPRARSNAS